VSNRQTDRHAQTDRSQYTVCSNRPPHMLCIPMQPNNNTEFLQHVSYSSSRQLLTEDHSTAVIVTTSIWSPITQVHGPRTLSGHTATTVCSIKTWQYICDHNPGTTGQSNLTKGRIIATKLNRKQFSPGSLHFVDRPTAHAGKLLAYTVHTFCYIYGTAPSPPQNCSFPWRIQNSI